MQEYRDVANTGQCAFDHYALYGEKEGRRPHPDLLLETGAESIIETPMLQLTAKAWEEVRRDPDFRAFISLEARFTQALSERPVLLDEAWYLTQIGEARSTSWNALAHFVTEGRAANLAPGPWLDPAWYLQEYPDVAASGQSAFDHYVLHGEQEGRQPRPGFMPRLALSIVPSRPRDLSVTAHAWVERCSDEKTGDPEWLLQELRAAWQSETQLASMPTSALLDHVRGTHSTYLQPYVDRVLDGFVEGSFLILVPHFMLGGADRVAVNMAAAAAEALGPDRVFVVSTDRGDTASKEWFPPGVTVRVMQPTRESRLDDDDLGRLMADLLMAGRPATVLNINSRAAWLAFSRHGMQLSQHMRLMATQFCRDFHDHGGFGGYGDEFLRDTIDYLDVVMLDNAQFRTDLIESLGLLEADVEKMHVVYQPSAIQPAELDMAKRDIKAVLWLGRIADQKRPDLLADVAGLMPELRFHVFGGPVNDKTVRKYGLDHPNLTLHGPVHNVGSLNPLDYGALLFTSGYEGLPNVPVEIASTGMPIVASDVGGIHELLAERGWLIPKDAPAQDYVDALREALEPDTGAARGATLRDFARARHCWPSFVERLRETGIIGS